MQSNWGLRALKLSVLLLLFAVFGCNFKSDNTSDNSIETTDMYGRTVMVPEKINRIVGVGPGALRLLVYMDLVDMVSGIEDIEFRPGRPYAFAHPSLKEKPVIGPYMGGDSELIAINKPDVIFMAFSSVSDADELQAKTGIPVIGLNSGNLRNARQTFYQALSLIAEITGKEVRADSLVSFIEQEIDMLKQLARKKSDNATAYIGGVSYRGAQGIASTQSWFTPFVLTSISNVAKNIEGREPVQPTGIYVDVEEIIGWNPDYLFLDAAGYEQVLPTIVSGSPLRKTIRAFDQNRVYTLMPHNFYATNFETVLINSWFAGNVVFPDAFKSVSFEDKAREIYRFMLGRDVYDQMKEMYEGWQQF
ncbi:ABC transporter substrate-binding protein [Marinilabilia salmonicolor]|uniref:ABC transporter substrate-binding protein n=1 Tax=Marinilabilia salmonicolor TaxID=989 RepID=UPI00030900C2|nr:ABC transporter substrate-binding protein [Marinilabilia salmonicolor]